MTLATESSHRWVKEPTEVAARAWWQGAVFWAFSDRKSTGLADSLDMKCEGTEESMSVVQ